MLFCKLTQYQQELYEDYVTGPDVAAMMVGRKKVCFSPDDSFFVGHFLYLARKLNSLSSLNEKTLQWACIPSFEVSLSCVSFFVLTLLFLSSGIV